ncbi:MAG: phospholipid carrier-dependent glycosyltransferase [Alphaproteobacteria bacterium]|nr:MAG: phospholipid carrier-dependent glycosyltransferase [Alphaproteobacteria bacterium]
MARRRKTSDAVWTGRVLAVLLAAVILRLGFNALELVPVHFDEAQYWTYGLSPDWGYYSKPPLTAWLIALVTGLAGETGFVLRLPVPLIHLWIGWLIYVIARRLFDARTGFWAATGYGLAPGVTVSSALMTTDPPMMLGWALALYALIRALTAKRRRKDPEPLGWWIVLGLALGAGTLAKYTALVFAGGGIGYALLSRQGALRWKGALAAALAWLAVMAPHLVWLAQNGFVSVAHLAENADQGLGLTPERLPEFLLTQAGVIGPVFFIALGWLFWRRAAWRGDWRVRLLVWLSAPLILAMCVQAVRGGANANWAAPSYIAGAILAAHWLLARGWLRGLKLQLATGIIAAVLIWGAAGVYAIWGTGLPRAPDPFKKMRVSGPLCERVLTGMEEAGADMLLSPDRRRLAECAWMGGLDIAQIRVWNPAGQITNHYEMVASLADAETGAMIFFTVRGDGSEVAARFAEAELLDRGHIDTHSDWGFDYAIWRVEGFRGYRAVPDG